MGWSRSGAIFCAIVASSEGKALGVWEVGEGGMKTERVKCHASWCFVVVSVTSPPFLSVTFPGA